MAEVKRKSGIRSPYAHALARLESLETAYATLSDLIEKQLGPALGYPMFCDDQRNFPNSTKEDGACVGESDAATLVAQAATRIGELRDKATDYARLEREYAGLCDRYDKLTEALGAQCAESTKLEREVERLRVDANRYRWLRDKAGNVDGESPLVCVVDNEGYQVDGQILVGAELDTVIDAALAKACGRKG